MYKILTCNCARNRLAQLGINFSISFWFDNCNCGTDHKIFATRCTRYLYDVVGFGRNYFASVNCSCYQEEKGLVCKHCAKLQHDPNFNTIKICIRKEDVPKDFKIWEIDNYLEMVLKAGLIFFYSPQKNCILISIDAVDWNDFFRDKETM